ncbi:unnamed protein product [Staurois parvus]|uniref:Neurotransmitter-gated ion-channel transmembrane domain-containing protein n=1 Tax=Staurois parvus TaxID=386267 RepID=A0ABN9HFR2_9NEOB|nr:unnamed protein product [Staurois parvus]
MTPTFGGTRMSMTAWTPSVSLVVMSGDPISSSIIGKYYIATMTMITASTALTIFIMNIHHCGPEAKPVPKWAKKFILQYMSRIFFVYEVGESCRRPQTEPEPERLPKGQAINGQAKWEEPVVVPKSCPDSSSNTKMVRRRDGLGIRRRS